MPVVMDAERISRALTRIAHEILEHNRGLSHLALVGVRSRGVPIAQRIAHDILQITKEEVAVGALDITLYRDDLMGASVGLAPLVRKTEIDVDQLYRDDGIYSYGNGWNMAAVIAFLAGVLPNLPGFLNAAFPAAFADVGDAFKTIYTYAWFVGVAISALVYGLMMSGKRVPALRPAARPQP